MSTVAEFVAVTFTLVTSLIFAESIVATILLFKVFVTELPEPPTPTLTEPPAATEIEAATALALIEAIVDRRHVEHTARVDDGSLINRRNQVSPDHIFRD